MVQRNNRQMMGISDADAASNSQNPPAMTTEAVESDLVGRTRRLSIESETSSYSVISKAPSVLSLDTNGSVRGGVAVPLSIDSFETYLEILADVDRNPKASIVRDEAYTVSVPGFQSTTSESQINKLASTASLPQPSPYWYQFFGFEPSPTISFQQEFALLVKHENWSTNERRKQLISALAAEIAHHYGTHNGKLHRWRQLCEDVGVDVVPKPITQCRKLLSPILVNLYDVIDHRRNPDTKILRFKSYGEFVRYTRAGHRFPKECAKEDQFISVFLKKI